MNSLVGVIGLVRVESQLEGRFVKWTCRWIWKVEFYKLGEVEERKEEKKRNFIRYL